MRAEIKLRAVVRVDEGEDAEMMREIYEEWFKDVDGIKIETTDNPEVIEFSNMPKEELGNITRKMLRLGILK